METHPKVYPFVDVTTVPLVLVRVEEQAPWLVLDERGFLWVSVRDRDALVPPPRQLVQDLRLHGVGEEDLHGGTL